MLRIPIEERKIDELVRQCRHHNVFPIHLDSHLYDERSHPVTLLLTKLVGECVEYLSMMNEEERKSVVLGIPGGFRMFIEDEPPDPADRGYLERVAVYYLAARLHERYFSVKDVVQADSETSAVLDVYPELREKLDDDGLLRIDSSLRPFDGGIEYKGHVLQYHQFLRRGYSSNPNFEFLARFCRYYFESGATNSFRIAIDHRRLMSKKFYRQMSERDTWFGPPFDRKKLDDPAEVGTTVVGRARPSVFDLTNKLDRTELHWKHKEGMKTFEIEEVSSSDYLFDSYCLNRYVHSERGIQRQYTRHFDGAVKVYAGDTYQRRLDTHMPRAEKCLRKIKLFRIDGHIDEEQWINLICFFYRDNEMLIEYFDPQLFERLFGEKIRKYQEVYAKIKGT